VHNYTKEQVDSNNYLPVLLLYCVVNKNRKSQKMTITITFLEKKMQHNLFIINLSKRWGEQIITK
jgi:hypothetical protein